MWHLLRSKSSEGETACERGREKGEEERPRLWPSWGKPPNSDVTSCDSAIFVSIREKSLAWPHLKGSGDYDKVRCKELMGAEGCWSRSLLGRLFFFIVRGLSRWGQLLCCWTSSLRIRTQCCPTTAPLCICYIVSVTVRAETLTLEDCFQGHIFGQREKECWGNYLKQFWGSPWVQSKEITPAIRNTVWERLWVIWVRKWQHCG